MQPQEVIIAPVISEKSHTAIQANKYTFKVARRASKTDVKTALKQLFNVDVEKVNIINVKRKQRSFGRYVGMTSAWRKAIVT
ncbi:MAG: 50S ribosomal protein L23, partial [bacterium]